jgi:hypothetical protein
MGGVCIGLDSERAGSRTLEKSLRRDRDRVCAKFERSRRFSRFEHESQKISRRCRGLGLDSAISRFIHSLGRRMLGSNPCRTVATTALSVRRSSHSARSHPFSMPYILHILPLFVDPIVEGVAQWTGRRPGPGSTLLHPFSLPVLPRLFLSCVVVRTLAADLFLVEARPTVPGQPPMSNSCQPFT